MTEPTAAPLIDRLKARAHFLAICSVPDGESAELMREAAAALAQLSDTTEFDNACKMMGRYDRPRDGAVSLSQAIEELAQRNDRVPREPSGLYEAADVLLLELDAASHSQRGNASECQICQATDKFRKVFYDAAPTGIPRDDALREDAELGRILMRYIDRLSDPDDECDPLPKIAHELSGAVNEAITRFRAERDAVPTGTPRKGERPLREIVDAWRESNPHADVVPIWYLEAAMQKGTQ